MKLLSFATPGGPRAGAKVDEGVVDLAAILAKRRPVTPVDSVLGIIESGVDIDAIAGPAIDELRARGELAAHLVADPQYLPPILRPSKILALALNYPTHLQ
jgi:2,4-didehydro-3-deoxy-L-rhamnonate hydrolase